MSEQNVRYDYLIVGAGLFGITAARALTDLGSRVLVVEKRNHIAGNAYTEEVSGICVHRYGAHIFHTDSERVWDFVNRFADFNGFVNEPVANWHGEIYSLPFNMNTFREMWGVAEPSEAKKIIDDQIKAAAKNISGEPANLEEQAICRVGTEIYEKLIKGYTEKQWGKSCRDLPPSIIKRVPVRFEYNNNYYNDRYQGIPVDGYTSMAERMLDGIELITGTDFLDKDNRSRLTEMAETVIYTGQIDAYYDYCFGPLEYRGLRFETEEIRAAGGFFQPRAVVNYTDIETPYTRIIEHKHFTEDNESPVTVITKEYPSSWAPGDEAFFPVNDEENRKKYDKYRALSAGNDWIIFGGRLGSYRYYDMDDVIDAALRLADEISGEKQKDNEIDKKV